MAGGHVYISGVAEWKGSETSVFVFLKDQEEEKIGDTDLGASMTFDAERYDFVVGHGLSLFGAEIK